MKCFQAINYILYSVRGTLVCIIKNLLTSKAYHVRYVFFFIKSPKFSWRLNSLKSKQIFIKYTKKGFLKVLFSMSNIIKMLFN